MRNLTILLLTVTIISCNNIGERNRTASGTKAPGEIIGNNNNVITFKVDGTSVQTNGWHIARSLLTADGKPLLNITTNMHDEPRTINVNLNGVTPGTYHLGTSLSGEGYGSYYPDFSDPANTYQAVDGSFVITELDTVRNIVNGTFSFSAKNSEGKTVQISDGKIINGTLTPGLERPYQ